MKVNLQEALGDWYPILEPVCKSPAMEYIGRILMKDQELLQPALHHIFRAFQLTPPDQVKVVILGQDPYPGGHANGLAFGSGNGDIPYSLAVIFKELDPEGIGMNFDITLADWARQGVLLLNRTLTTVKGALNYHYDIGWEQLTGAALRWVGQNVQDPVFMVWGSYAADTYKEFVAPLPTHPNQRLVLKAPHPSAQRHGYQFIGCGHFQKCNEYLVARGKTPIVWNKD